MEYRDFLESKKKKIIQSGFDIEESELNPNMFEFQKFIVKRALKAAKYAIFADCGLGKTLMQLEWANHVMKFTNMPGLILTPLAVSGQTILEGEKFGIEVKKYSNQTEKGIYITNYEQLENIDCSIFGWVVLDESSILKNYNGKTKETIIESFRDTRFKLACTASPSPNDYIELGNHAEFLNICRSKEMVSEFFINDAFSKENNISKIHQL